jgi:hypothetical protein
VTDADTELAVGGGCRRVNGEYHPLNPRPSRLQHSVREGNFKSLEYSELIVRKAEISNPAAWED